MNKDDFIKLYRSKITIWFNNGEFISDNRVIVREGEITLEEVGNYFCPWYYDIRIQQEIKAPFEEILSNPQARAVAIKDVEGKIKFGSKSQKIQQYIEDFKEKMEKSLCPFPIATDSTFNKSLVLDGNKTLVALYQSWEKDKKIPLAEIYGANLIRILPDFCIGYKS